MQAKNPVEADTPAAAKAPVRTVIEWRPEPLLCKRFNVPDPFAGKRETSRPAPGSMGQQLLGVPSEERGNVYAAALPEFMRPTDVAAPRAPSAAQQGGWQEELPPPPPVAAGSKHAAAPGAGQGEPDYLNQIADEILASVDADFAKHVEEVRSPVRQPESAGPMYTCVCGGTLRLRHWHDRLMRWATTFPPCPGVQGGRQRLPRGRMQGKLGGIAPPPRPAVHHGGVVSSCSAWSDLVVDVQAAPAPEEVPLDKPINVFQAIFADSDSEEENEAEGDPAEAAPAAPAATGQAAAEEAAVRPLDAAAVLQEAQARVVERARQAAAAAPAAPADADAAARQGSPERGTASRGSVSSDDEEGRGRWRGEERGNGGREHRSRGKRRRESEESDGEGREGRSLKRGKSERKREKEKRRRHKERRRVDDVAERAAAALRDEAMQQKLSTEEIIAMAKELKRRNKEKSREREREKRSKHKHHKHSSSRRRDRQSHSPSL